MGTILHPTDFSETSRSAFEHALCLAFVGQHKLTILHVETRAAGSADWSQFPRIRETLAGWDFIAADMSPADLTTSTGMSVQKVNAFGSDPAAATAHYLERHPADLIVVGTQGRTGLDAWVHKSLAVRLADAVMQPVLFVREGISGLVGASTERKQMTVLVPVDHEPDPQHAMDYVWHLRDVWNLPVGAILGIHVGNEPLSPPVIFSDQENIRHEMHQVTGDPSEEIINSIPRTGADLIVMTRAGPDGVVEKFIGSTTERVIQAASCPVLVLRAPSYDQPR
ncbi:MAG: universal stress protein [Pseudomonadota bacterium]